MFCPTDPVDVNATNFSHVKWARYPTSTLCESCSKQCHWWLFQNWSYTVYKTATFSAFRICWKLLPKLWQFGGCAPLTWAHFLHQGIYHPFSLIWWTATGYSIISDAWCAPECLWSHIWYGWVQILLVTYDWLKMFSSTSWKYGREMKKHVYYIFWSVKVLPYV